MEIDVIVNIFVGVLSFVLAAISVITVIITLRQNKKLLEANEHQLEEMRHEHQLSIQPIIIAKDMTFRIEKPRFFYSPPENEYTFQSRYYCDSILCNMGNATAISTDATAILIIPQEKKATELRSITERINLVLGTGGEASYHEMISGDDAAQFYSAIRESGAYSLPQIVITSTYKNACGGYFLTKQKFILVPNSEELSLIQIWHSAISSASTVFQEGLARLKKMQRNNEWNAVFDEIKQEFNQIIGNTEQDYIDVRCVEIPQDYTFLVISEDEYKKKAEDYAYGQFVHKAPNCKESDK